MVISLGWAEMSPVIVVSAWGFPIAFWMARDPGWNSRFLMSAAIWVICSCCIFLSILDFSFCLSAVACCMSLKLSV